MKHFSHTITGRAQLATHHMSENSVHVGTIGLILEPLAWWIRQPGPEKVSSVHGHPRCLRVHSEDYREAHGPDTPARDGTNQRKRSNSGSMWPSMWRPVILSMLLLLSGAPAPDVLQLGREGPCSRICYRMVPSPLLSTHGTHKTVKARFWP